jgi:membrane-bound ClpP family serine protease
MRNFFYLEGAYLILGFIILMITLFVTTRPFMSKGAIKKGMTGVTLVLALMILIHHKLTIKRMNEVQQAFQAGKTILCESRMQRKVAPIVVIHKDQGWELKEDNFISSDYIRSFFSARCIVE